MKKTGALILCLLLAGCDRPDETQLITETGHQLQRTIDMNPQRGVCEQIARGRERLSKKTVQQLEAQECQHVLRSSTETSFTRTRIYQHSMTMVCGEIKGKNFTGEEITRRFIFSPGEKALVIEPVSAQDKSRFQDLKTLQQIHNDFERQQAQYCQ
ncbi:hypothetical protein [[Erwinia] mediterraneensis]|uniref:hypothetical protein n=1 Tax=[Erwinia] mediterraneensis TaxID=2161819 RepID=UPI001030B719|nr:hypothetical protein [[Erwinia] mediterraneensis]